MDAPDPQNFRARSRSLLPLLLLPLLALLLVGIYALSNVSRTTQSLRHTDEVRVAIERLRSTLLNAETGVRGYLVAGETTFLQPYHEASRNWPAHLERVRVLTAGDADQQERLARLDHLIRVRLEFLRAQLTKFDGNHRGDELTPIMLDGKRTMDRARALVDEMEEVEARLDADRQQVAVRNWRWTLVVFVGGMLCFLFVAVVAWIQRREAVARRQAAAAIDAERSLLKAVVSGIDDGITLQDRGGKLVFANASAARLIGFATPEELLAAPVSELMKRFEIFDENGAPFPPEKLPARIILEGSAGEASALMRYRVRDTGQERWSMVRAFAVVDPAGQVAQAINVFRDVTAEHEQGERRAFLLRAVDELSSSLDYERTLAAVARLAVPTLADWCAVDIREGDRTRRVAIAHVDPTKVSLVAELERRYPADPKATTGVVEIIRTGRPQLIAEIPRAMLLAAARDEEHLKLIDALDLSSYVGVPLIVGGRTIGAITCAMAESRRRYTQQDLTFAQALADRAALAIENARKFGEVETARATTTAQLADETVRRRQAEDASRFAEMFVGILGHDLRNPLNAVIMTTRLLQRKGSGEAEALGRISSSAQRMANMVDQLLDLTRSRLAGGITVNQREVDLAAAVSEIVDEMRLANPGRDIRWETHLDERALLDEDRLAQVIYNLIGNAVEHGDPLRPVTIGLSARGGDLTLTVHNQGPPIPSDLLPVMFDPFRRTTVRGERSKGLGLGLFITHQIVQAHGGSIVVHSTAEQGTTFTVVLPRRVVGKVASSDGGLVA